MRLYDDYAHHVFLGLGVNYLSIFQYLYVHFYVLTGQTLATLGLKAYMKNLI